MFIPSSAAYALEALMRKQQALTIKSLVLFCLEHGGGLYAGWSVEKLYRYFTFHLFNGQIVWATDGPDIDGVLIAWPDSAEAILRRQRSGEAHFAWRLEPHGYDALMFGDVVVRSPRKKKSASRLLQMASARWPDWKMRRLFTHRRGKLHELSPAAVRKLIAHGLTS